jgi:hypothetical protein
VKRSVALVGSASALHRRRRSTHSSGISPIDPSESTIDRRCWRIAASISGSAAGVPPKLAFTTTSSQSIPLATPSERLVARRWSLPSISRRHPKPRTARATSRSSRFAMR